jgi:hypothetical protein
MHGSLDPAAAAALHPIHTTRLIALLEETGELIFGHSRIAQEAMQQPALELLVARNSQRLALRFG